MSLDTSSTKRKKKNVAAAATMETNRQRPKTQPTGDDALNNILTASSVTTSLQSNDNAIPLFAVTHNAFSSTSLVGAASEGGYGAGESGGGGSGDASNNQPNLNILHLANGISQFKIDNDTFNPKELDRHHLDDGEVEPQPMLPSFLIHGHHVGSGNTLSSPLAYSNLPPSGLTTPNQQHRSASALAPPSLQQQAQLSHSEQRHSMGDSLFLQGHSLLDNAAAPQQQHQQLQMQQLQQLQHQLQLLQQHELQESGKKLVPSGRIPATKHDNRKLFVGGLPNDGKSLNKQNFLLLSFDSMGWCVEMDYGRNVNFDFLERLILFGEHHFQQLFQIVYLNLESLKIVVSTRKEYKHTHLTNVTWASLQFYLLRLSHCFLIYNYNQQ